MESLTKTEGVLHLEGIGKVDHEARVDLLQDLLLRDHHRLPLPLLDPLLLQLLASIPGHIIIERRLERRRRGIFQEDGFCLFREAEEGEVTFLSLVVLR